MPTSLEFQAQAAPQFVQEFWPQIQEVAARERLSDARKVILCGCGDSHHAAYTLSYAFSNWTGRSARGLHAMEAARYAIPQSNEDGLLVVGISASGETARTIEAVRLSREAGARTIAITTKNESTLAAEAHSTIHLDLPAHPEGPGLISYLAALLAGFALTAHWAESKLQELIDNNLRELANQLPDWLTNEVVVGQELAEEVDPEQPIMFLGSGPISGSAMFSAAKVIEAAGQSATSQDVEEWAHLEYFNEPSQLPIWLLGAHGRTLGREREVVAAANQIGRRVISSEWKSGSDVVREQLSALTLWAGPVAYANSLMVRIGEQPFRAFGGGRSPEEGGGASVIRSSEQSRSLKDLSKFNPMN